MNEDVAFDTLRMSIFAILVTIVIMVITGIIRVGTFSIVSQILLNSVHIVESLLRLFAEIHLVGQGSFADAVVNVSNGLC